MGSNLSQNQDRHSRKKAVEVVLTKDDIAHIHTHSRHFSIGSRGKLLIILNVGLIPSPQGLWIRKITKVEKPNSSDVWGIRVLEQAVHLVDGELHGEELVEKAEGGGWAAAVAGHPRLDVVDLVVDLVDDLVVGLDLV